MPQVETVFEKLRPQTARLFHEMYRDQFTVWGREFQRRGIKAAIQFRQRKGTPVLFDANGDPIQKGAWLRARVEREGERMRVVIEPDTEHDVEKIEKHVREMSSLVLN